MSSELEAIVYLEDIFFFSISLVYYLKNFSFSLCHLDAFCTFLADLNSNFSSIFFLIDALDHLTKASCTKQTRDNVAVAELLPFLDLVEFFFYSWAGCYILYSFVANCVDFFEITDLSRLKFSKLIFESLLGFGRCYALFHDFYLHRLTFKNLLRNDSLLSIIGRCTGLSY